MNLATISLAYLKARSLNTLLNILLLALGVSGVVLAPAWPLVVRSTTS